MPATQDGDTGFHKDAGDPMATRNKARDQETRRARYRRNRELERLQQRAYRAANLERIREQQRQYREANKDAINAKARASRLTDPEKYRAKDRERGKCPLHRARASARVREWVAANKQRALEYQRQYRRKKIGDSPAYKAQIAMRRRFYMAVRNQVYDGWSIRSGEAVRLLGCTMAEFVRYLESLWLPGMTWANWSRDGWHIDHIVPLSAFDLTDDVQRRAACRYTNLRPLWAKDNLAKGSKVNGLK